MLDLFYLLLFIAIVVFIIRPFTTFVHELGHAIPALLLTKEEVTIYLGSFGDPDKSTYFKWGRLSMFYKYDTTLWNHGLCVHSGRNLSIDANILITAMGPITSLVLGVLVAFLATRSEGWDQNFNLLGIFFFVCCLLDFWYNIVPTNNPSKLHSGQIVYNDGYKLKELLAMRRE